MNTYVCGDTRYERVRGAGRVHVRVVGALATRCGRTTVPRGGKHRTGVDDPVTCRDCLVGLDPTNGDRDPSHDRT